MIAGTTGYNVHSTGLRKKPFGLITKNGLTNMVARNTPSKGVGKYRRLFKYFLLHKVAVLAFFCNLIFIIQLL